MTTTNNNANTATGKPPKKKESTSKWPEKIIIIVPKGVQFRNPKDKELIRKEDKEGKVDLTKEIELKVEANTFWKKMVNTHQVIWKDMPKGFELPPKPIRYRSGL